MGWRSLEGAWFVEDSVKLRPNLTLRLGLRHEFTTGYNESHGRGPNFVTDSTGVLLTNPRVADSPLSENDATRLFSPRVGLAWDVFGNGKTAVRSGFGMYYTLLDDLDFHLNSIAPFNSLFAFQGPTLTSILPIIPGVAPPPVCGLGVPKPCTTYAPEGIQPNMKTPAAAEWDFSIEQELTGSTALRLAYVGSHGYHNIVNQDLNTIAPQICATAGGCISGGLNTPPPPPAPPPMVPQGALYIPPGNRPNQYLSNGFFWMSAGIASYHAFQAEVNRRLARGLQFRLNYTFSKNLDNGSGLSSSQSINQAQQMLNRFAPKSDWGLSALDVRHRFSTAASYELPFGQGRRWLSNAHGVSGKLVSGWQLNTILTFESGFPLTPQLGSNRSGDGNSRNPDRPDWNPAFSGPVILNNPNQWFNPNAFLLPTSGTYGNVGRGTLTGPGLGEVDLSFFKNTQFTERLALQFRAEAFNLLNHSNFGVPNPVVFQGASVSSSAGLVTNTATTSRQIQFGLKLIF